jgi:hypothetical protein
VLAFRNDCLLAVVVGIKDKKTNEGRKNPSPGPAGPAEGLRHPQKGIVVSDSDFRAPLKISALLPYRTAFFTLVGDCNGPSYAIAR